MNCTCMCFVDATHPHVRTAPPSTAGNTSALPAIAQWTVTDSSACYHPVSRATAYWTDAELQSNTTKIHADILHLLGRLQSNKYTTLVIPEKSFGTGLSKLPAKAPKTFQRLKSAVHKMLEDLQEGSSAHMKW